MTDPDVPGGAFVHWIVTRIDPTLRSVEAGHVPPGAVGGENSAGSHTYYGPCPPPGPAHHYHFSVWAEGHRPGVGPGSSPRDALREIAAAAIAHGELVGTFARQP